MPGFILIAILGPLFALSTSLSRFDNPKTDPSLPQLSPSVQDALNRIREMGGMWDITDFNPNEVVSRIEACDYVASLLYRKNVTDQGTNALTQMPDLAFLTGDLVSFKLVSELDFRDMPFNGRFEGIYRMTRAGVVNGYPDGKFRQYEPVTREEFITMVGRAVSSMRILRTLEYHGNVFFNDVDDRRYSLGPIIVAAAAGIVEGVPGNRILPYRRLKQYEMVLILDRLLKLVE